MVVRRVIYLAHPVGSALVERAANLARALRWLRWAILAHPGNAFAVPWLPYCQVLSEEHRERGIRDDLEMLRRCDELWLVGGRVSPGMAAERAEAERHGIPVVDLSEMGPEPPGEEGV